MEHTIPWIWLATRAGISPQVRVQLVRTVGTPLFLLGATAETLPHDLPTATRNALLEKDTAAAEKIAHTCATLDIRVVVQTDDDYPSTLRYLDEAPLVLYLRGKLPNFQKQPPLTLIGTRAVSPYGLEMTKQFATAFVQMGASLVLGTSLGVETAALTAALDAGGSVLAVQVGGVELDYPKENTALLTRLVQEGGILSEHPPAVEVAGFRFLQRNQLLASLSEGVLVVEAPPRSGALTTVEAAYHLGKPVCALPTNLNAHGNAGNLLVEAGKACFAYDPAHAVEILTNTALWHPPLTAVRANFYRAIGGVTLDDKPIKTPQPRKKSHKQPQAPQAPTVQGIPTALTGQARAVAQALLDGVHMVDDISAKLQLPTELVTMEITLLELDGYVTNQQGLYYWD